MMLPPPRSRGQIHIAGRGSLRETWHGSSTRIRPWWPATTLLRLPPLIASLESGTGAATSGGPSLVEPADPPRWRDSVKPGSKVVVRLGPHETEYDALGISGNHLLASGRTPVPENLLLEMRLTCEPPLTCWASAKLCWSEGSIFSTLLQPFALDEEARTRWQRLVALATRT